MTQEIIFSSLDGIELDRFIVSTDYLETDASSDVLSIAREMAVGQTRGTWVPVPEETEEWFEKMGDYLQDSSRLTEQGDFIHAVACFSILYELIDLLNDGEEIVFGDETGSWMIPTDEKQYNRAFLKALAVTATPQEFAAVVVSLARQDSRYNFYGEVYATVQGKVIVGGFAASGQAASIQSNNVSSGTVANGVTIERVLCQQKVGEAGYVDFHLRNPDRQTAERILNAINKRFPRKAQLLNRASIRVAVPIQQTQTAMELFLNEIQNLTVEPDNTAKIIYNEHSGTIVITSNAKLRPVAITFGSLMISTTETPQASQPNAFSDGETVVLPRTTLTANEDANELRILQQSNSLRDLVDGLNALGVSAREMGNVLINLEKSGALQAELVFE